MSMTYDCDGKRQRDVAVDCDKALLGALFPAAWLCWFISRAGSTVSLHRLLALPHGLSRARAHLRGEAAIGIGGARHRHRPPSTAASVGIGHLLSIVHDTYLSATIRYVQTPHMPAHGSRVDEAERPSSSEVCVPPPPIYDFGATEREHGARLHPRSCSAAQRGPNPAGAALSPLFVLRAAGQQVVFPVLASLASALTFMQRATAASALSPSDLPH
ncbi:hypothetical protein B0H14DRAFT_3855527 [Mycena olivaceomarginata]|nr:hypothetical protein B0H14DRAFT_3855527 [Mycena olivaceomarginata]